MAKAFRYAGILGIVCVVMAAAIAGSYSAMRDRIQQKKLEVVRMALADIVPDEKGEWRTLGGADFDDPNAIFAAVNDRGETLAYAAKGVQQGYSSKVELMVGVEAGFTSINDARIIAARVVAQQETPGLGTRIEERRSSKSFWKVVTFSREEEVFTNPFLDRFAGKTYGQLQVVKNPDPERIQAVTAATISSTAAVDAARKAVDQIAAAVQGPPNAESQSEAPSE